MKNYEWKSSLSEYILRYIALKRTSGLKLASQEIFLQFFDRLHFYGGYQGTEITREMVREFGVFPKSMKRANCYFYEFVQKSA